MEEVEETGDGRLLSSLWPEKHPRPFQGAFTSCPKCRRTGPLCLGTGASKVECDGASVVVFWAGVVDVSCVTSPHHHLLCVYFSCTTSAALTVRPQPSVPAASARLLGRCRQCVWQRLFSSCVRYWRGNNLFAITFSRHVFLTVCLLN